MWCNRLFRALACTLLLYASCRAWTCPSDSTLLDPIVPSKSKCPVEVRVGSTYCPVPVPLQETVEFSLYPTAVSKMYMHFEADNMMYTAMLSGTYVRVNRCDERESNCTELYGGGIKTSDYLVVNRWNQVLVNFTNGEVSVDINSRSVMTDIRMTEGPAKGSGKAQVTFLVPPSTPSYTALLRIPCSSSPQLTPTEQSVPTISPDSSTSPVSTTSIAMTSPSTSAFEACPKHQVEVDHPLDPIPVVDHLTLAVYPSQPGLYLVIGNKHFHMKVNVEAFTAELLMCESTTTKCSEMDATDGDYLLLHTKEWNVVKISLLDKNLIISINDTQIVTANLQSNNVEGLRVSVVAPKDSVLNTDEHYLSVLVKINCEVTESTGEPEASEIDAPGISRNVGIVVGVLVAVLLIIALAITVTTIRKRRVASLNQPSPLQNQYQQQY